MSEQPRGPVAFGDYLVSAKLAEGGMAEIYLATQRTTGGPDKPVVIKSIRPELASEPLVVSMLYDEARIAARIDHPNVVKVFAVGEAMGRHYIAMEYLIGHSLGDLLGSCQRRGVALPVGLAAGIVLQAARGLHHAHTLCDEQGQPLGVVHRDVCPHNIFVLDSGVVRVVDFGIAKAVINRAHTQIGHIKGKLTYMSPEQVAGEEIDARSDVYALGVVLWECLANRKLRNPELPDFTLMKEIVDRDAPPLDKVRRELAGASELVKITARALARKPKKRFDSAAELSEALADFLRRGDDAGDEAAIAGWMKEHFGSRSQRKGALVQGALDDGTAQGKVLFDFIEKYDFFWTGTVQEDLSEVGTRDLVVGSEPLLTDPAGVTSRRHRLVWAAVVLAAVIAVVAMVSLGLGGAPDTSAALPTETSAAADAGAAPGFDQGTGQKTKKAAPKRRPPRRRKAPRAKDAKALRGY